MPKKYRISLKPGFQQQIVHQFTQPTRKKISGSFVQEEGEEDKFKILDLHNCSLRERFSVRSEARGIPMLSAGTDLLCRKTSMFWYTNVLVRRPYFMLLAITILCVACIIATFLTSPTPDFSDPTLGFETRGTSIGKRLTTWHNLIHETALVADPNDIRLCENVYAEIIERNRRKNRKKGNRNRKRKNKRRKNKPKQHRKIEEEPGKIINFKYDDDNVTPTNNNDSLQWNGAEGIFRGYETINSNESSSPLLSSTEQFSYGRNMTSIDEDYHREKVHAKKSTWMILQKAALPPTNDAGDDSDGIHANVDGYFCDSPSKEYSHFVIERIGPNGTDSLFDLNALLAMCQLQDQITAVKGYEDFCEKEILTNNCCRPWSLANYAAQMANKSSCFDLTANDVESLKNLLLSCFDYFHDLKISNDCNEYNRCYAPNECTRHNTVFNILHFLADYNFIRVNSSDVFLKYAMIFVPVAQTTKILTLFHEWEKIDLKNEILEVIAMDLGLENVLFNECLLTDGWLVALGGIFVMASIWLYTTSMFLTIMTCVAVFFSLGLAYFIYTLVFEMSFFPYMNLLAVVVTIGTGADDAFIFMKIWQCTLAERFTKSSTITTQSASTVEAEHKETLQNLMTLTLRHAAISMLVTSLTTAGAFYASYTSNITAIKCFGIFAGTTVITNYLLMVTWLPASVSIMERLSGWTKWNRRLQVQKMIFMTNKSIRRFSNLFENAIISAVMKYAPLLVLLFVTIGLCCSVIVLYRPGLQLPQSDHFQLLVDTHPFEKYNAKLRHEFWFEKSLSAFANFKLPLRFVWGVLPVDDGDYTDPNAHGNLYYDNNFNISSKSAQLWLLQFCQRLKQQPFYQLTFGLLLPNCFIENFVTFMNRMCIDGMSNTDRTPCCDISKFPYEPHVFELCLPQSISSLYATPKEYFIPGVAGPKFFAPPLENLEKQCPYSMSGEEAEEGEQETSNETITLIAETPPPPAPPSSSSSSSSSLPPTVKAIVIEFESNISYTTVYDDIKQFVSTVENWFINELNTAPDGLRNGWFISELKFFDVQDTLSFGTIIAILVAMSVSLIVLFLVTLNVLISLYAIVTVLLTIFTIVAILILLGWKLNVLESVTVSTAIGLAVDFSLHFGIHYRLSPTSERIAATQFALSRIIGPTAMAALTTGFAGCLMLASSVLPYIQIGIFLLILMTVSWLYATFFLMSLLKLFGPQYGYMQFSYPNFRKRPNSNGIKFYDSSAVGDLITSETHELESLTSNSNIVKTISGSGSDCLRTADYEYSSVPYKPPTKKQAASSIAIDADNVGITIPATKIITTTTNMPSITFP